MSKRLQAGKDLLEKGQFEQAIKELSIQISSEKEDIQAIYLRGIAYRKLGDLNASLKDFDRAISINPQQADLLCDRAIVYHFMQKGDAAIADMNRAVEMEPENPFRYSSRAYIREMLKDTKGAIADYNKAIELDPEDEISLNNLGLLQEKVGRMKEAQKSFKKSDSILKQKGRYVENKETLDLKKDELKINRTADGKISFESQKKEKAVKEEEVQVKTVGRKIGFSEYLKTLKKVFSSKEELGSFFEFVRTFFKKPEN